MQNRTSEKMDFNITNKRNFTKKIIDVKVITKITQLKYQTAWLQG